MHYEGALLVGIANLTQHTPTADQKAEGVHDTAQATKEEVVNLLTCATLPTVEELRDRASKLADKASRYRRALIGGAPYLMPHLERALVLRGVQPLYAFTTRVSTEEVQANGEVRKVSHFKHAGFVPADPAETSTAMALAKQFVGLPNGEVDDWLKSVDAVAVFADKDDPSTWVFKFDDDSSLAIYDANTPYWYIRAYED